MTQDELMEAIEAAIPDHGQIWITRILRLNGREVWSANVYAKTDNEESIEVNIATCTQVYCPEDVLVEICKTYTAMAMDKSKEIEKLERQLSILRGE